MARLTGPDEACRVVYVNSGTNKGKASAQGMSAPLYLDQALTMLADVVSTTDGAIAGSTVIVDAYSKIPLVKYPEGVDTLWTSINGGPAVPLYARTDDRLDALAAADAAEAAARTAADAGKAQVYATTSKSAPFTATVWTMHLVDTTGGAVPATLPAGNVAGQQLAIKLNAGTNPITIVPSGTDTIGPAATTASMTLASEVWEFVSSGTGQWNLIGGNKSLASLDGRFMHIIASATPFAAAAAIKTSPTIAVFGYDSAAGQLLGSDRTNGNISLSDNLGSTWGNLMGIPAGVTGSSVQKLVGFGSYLYGTFVTTADGLLGVYRAPKVAATAGVGALVWSSRLAAASPSTSSLNGKSTIFAAGSTALMLGDYGDFTAGPSIQRSLDGTTWTTVYGPDPAQRHIHCVAEDPFNPGTWYASIGDNSATKSMIRSTNNGTTWVSILPVTGSNQWQGVQISFDAKYVYVASDRLGASAIYFDRVACSPAHLTTNYHFNEPVPGGVGGRNVTDLATTSASTTVTSASAAFTSADVGRAIATTNLPTTPYITAVSNSTTVTASVAATATGTNQTATIRGDRFFALAYLGAVDPNTGVFYLLANDTSVQGTHFGIFTCRAPGSRLELLDFGRSADGFSIGEVFIAGGRMWVGNRSYALVALV